MCGITGILNLNSDEPIEETTLRRMLASLRHRGPDQFGIYLNRQVGLGNARLSIIDLSSGQQPISNEDDTLWIVFNGEIFNYVELRPVLESRGHTFKTNTDTEVILHLYEDHGPDCLRHLNGQFAIAIWDARDQSLFLARDRVGIRPIFYALRHGRLVFGSEIKSLLASQLVQAEIDPQSLDQIFTFWSTVSPKTTFKDIYEVPAGHYLLAKENNFRLEQYWQLDFPAFNHQPVPKFAEVVEEFGELLIDATQIRLRADVPVGAYLSGGLDSSTTSAIIRNYTNNRLDTFSIAFSDPDFDESSYQKEMAAFLGTEHQVIYADYHDIGQAFFDSIWHTETPILRTSPAPLYLLSRLVRQNNYKVVLTGEGADEFLAGYNIFKEAMVRRFWSRQPDSKIRPLLLQKLYPYIKDLASGSSYLNAFFGEGLTETDSPFYSHVVRWRNNSRTKRFFSNELQVDLAGASAPMDSIKLPAEFHTWHPLHQAQYLEISIFLSEYLLSSQGDRVGMAHSIEGRYPFLDYRVIEFSNRIPPEYKLRGLTEKFILRKLASRWLPAEIWQRPKRPYRAPIHRSFFNAATLETTLDLLSEDRINLTGYFKSSAVMQLVNKAVKGAKLSETDDMALAGILSTQLVHSLFVDNFRIPEPLGENDDVKFVRDSKVTHP